MTLYAESSAVLSWILGEPKGDSVRRQLRRANIIVSSDLTLVDCDRVIVRARSLDAITAKRALSCRNRLAAAASRWNLLRLAPEIIERARLPFPKEPLRTLDALHLASALMARNAVPDIVVLSLDSRVRSCAAEMGFAVVPKSN